jgi:hypothetical protein
MKKRKEHALRTHSMAIQRSCSPERNSQLGSALTFFDELEDSDNMEETDEDEENALGA